DLAPPVVLAPNDPGARVVDREADWPDRLGDRGLGVVAARRKRQTLGAERGSGGEREWDEEQKSGAESRSARTKGTCHVCKPPAAAEGRRRLPLITAAAGQGFWPGVEEERRAGPRPGPTRQRTTAPGSGATANAGECPGRARRHTPRRRRFRRRSSRDSEE